MLPNNSACTCNDQDDINLKFPANRPVSPSKPKVIKLDFGEVRVGYQKSARALITNSHDEYNNYSVVYNPKTNPWYRLFTTPTRSCYLSPGEELNIRVTYRPLTPWTVDSNFISIKHDEEEKFRVEVKGISIGPSLQISTSYLSFNTWPQMKSLKKTLVIRNMSAFPVEYSFDLDNKPMPIFKIVPNIGVIDAKRQIIISIIFRATTFGEYSMRFFCMIHNHPPLRIDCFGVYWRSKEERDIGKMYLQQPEVVENFYASYMRDVQVTAMKKPMFSIIDSYINFGTVEFKTGKENTLVTSFTNHRKNDIIVKWFDDEYFKVAPAQTEIPGNDSILFEFTFCPTMADNIYSRNLCYNVFSTASNDCDEIAIPIPGVIRVLGHSFSDSNCWIPQFQINPRIVVLPMGLAGETSYATLELRSGGYLPTSFQFISPTASNFLVKPMMGSVRGVTIAVVQMQNPKMNQLKFFTENWHILLNNDINHTIPICFISHIEIPSATIGDKNSIKIQGVQVGCEEIVTVPIFNTCNLHIHFEFKILQLPKDIKILPPTGNLSPYGVNHISVSFKSTARIRAQYSVTCLLYAIRNLTEIYGLPMEINVLLHLESDVSNLCSIPSRHDFGVVECHSEHSTEFRLYNFGNTTVHFKLSLLELNAMEYCKNTTLTPIYSSLESKGHVHCNINFSPQAPGMPNIRVYYELRPTSDTLKTIENTLKLIYQFKANVIYPFFQIIEIADHNFGPLFSKRSLWECLNINWLNYALANVRHNDDTMCVSLNLPELEINNKHFYIALMVQNQTQFPVGVVLKRQKMCACPLKEVEGFLSLRKRRYQCPHRQMCELFFMDETILPHQMHCIMVQVTYFCNGATMLAYNLSLNNNRNITLYFKHFAIDTDTERLSMYRPTYSLVLPSVCIRVKQPNVYILWFYNNAKTPVKYDVDEYNFTDVNNNFRFTVWKCLNPSGTVPAYCAHPLLIHYQLLETKSVLLQILLAFGNRTVVQISIRARGTSKKLPNKGPKLYLPRADYTGVPAYLSMDRLRIAAFPVWGTTTRLIFITNVSNDILGYNWLKADIMGLCCAEVLEPNRVLHPNQSDVIIVQIKSFDKPCTTRINLPCQLMSHTKSMQHEKSVQDYHRRSKEIQNEFIITESGTTYPENDLIILPKPSPFYVTLAIEIEIKSQLDRDLCFDVTEQFKLEPQRTFTSCVDTLPCKLNYPTIAFMYKARDKSTVTDSTSSMNVLDETDNFDRKVDNMAFYLPVFEALLADTLLSAKFRGVLNMQNNAAPIYYSQIRRRPEEHNPEYIEQHIKNMYNSADMPFMKKIFQTLLLGSIGEIFDLKTDVHHTSLYHYKREIQHVPRRNERI